MSVRASCTNGSSATPMSLITSNCRDGSWRLTVTARCDSADTSSGKAITGTAAFCVAGVVDTDSVWFAFKSLVNSSAHLRAMRTSR